MKEISVTDDFLTLDKTIIKCQNQESLQDCKTRKYIDAMVEQCKCLPFAIRNDNEVCFSQFKQALHVLQSWFNGKQQGGQWQIGKMARYREEIADRKIDIAN